MVVGQLVADVENRFTYLQLHSQILELFLPWLIIVVLELLTLQIKLISFFLSLSTDDVLCYIKLDYTCYHIGLIRNLRLPFHIEYTFQLSSITSSDFLTTDGLTLDTEQTSNLVLED